MRNKRARLMAWWYVSISAGFLCLAFFYAIRGARPALIALRFLIAVGFALLAWAGFRESRR